MKNIILLHGTGETENSFWYPWLKEKVKEKGYTFSLPALPDRDDPDISKWLPVTLKENYDEETVLIGHSAGTPLMLSILENIKVRVKQAIFVAAYYEPVNSVTKILQSVYEWEKIKAHVGESIIINSDNDPWKCDDKQGIRLFEKLGGNLILRHGEGHMGSDMYKQPYKEFPLVLKLID